MEVFQLLKQFASILASFVKIQMKQFFPLRSDEEVQLYSNLFSMVTQGVLIPCMKSEMELLNCIQLLMPLDERGKNVKQE